MPADRSACDINTIPILFFQNIFRGSPILLPVTLRMDQAKGKRKAALTDDAPSVLASPEPL